MRIAHVTIVHKPLDIRIFHKECRTLARAGHDVHLLVPDPPAEQVDGVQFHALPGLGGINYFWRALRRLPAVYGRARAVAAEVYHLHDPHLIPLGLMLKRSGATVVYDAHEDAPRQAVSIWADRPFVSRSHKLIWSLLERLARRYFDSFISATPAIQRSFPSSVLVHNFALEEEFELECFRESGQSYAPRKPLVAYAGGITRVRGIREMVRMLELLPPDLDARLQLMGAFSNEQPELEAEVRALPGWRRVDHLGLLPRNEMVEVLGRARLGLVLLHPLPNHVEAMPNKMWEYMAARLPLVASNFPSWQRIVGDIGCGLLVDPQDPAAVADAVEWLLRHPAEAAEMGKRGREAFETRFSWSSQAEVLLRFYAELSSRLEPPAVEAAPVATG